MAELATPSTFGPSSAVADKLPPTRVSVVAADPRAYRLWRRAGQRPLPLVVPLQRERELRRRAASAIEAAWSRFESSTPFFTFGGINITRQTIGAIAPIVRRSGPWLLVEDAAIQSALEAIRPAVVVLASDQHRIGRLAVKRCREQMIKTVVLQHGLPQSEMGYIPVAADIVIVWSDASRDWFVDHGTRPDQLVVLGNPRLDWVAETDRDRTRKDVERQLRLRGTPRLLLVLSPNERQRLERQVEQALDVLELEPRASLVVKLHPGARGWRFVRQRIGRRLAIKDRVRVVHRAAVEPLLLWADVALVHRSTVAVEALAVGTPVIVSGEPESTADNELEGLGLPRAMSAPQLGELAQTYASDASRDAERLRLGERLMRLTGPLDGHSASRIAHFLQDL